MMCPGFAKKVYQLCMRCWSNNNFRFHGSVLLAIMISVYPVILKQYILVTEVLTKGHLNFFTKVHIHNIEKYYL